MYCYKFDVKIATILAHQLQKVDSDIGDYVSLLMRKQQLQEQSTWTAEEWYRTTN